MSSYFASSDKFDAISVEFHTDSDVLAELKDDSVHYIVYNDGNVTGGPYSTDWNLNNVDFVLADAKMKVFNYT